MRLGREPGDVTDLDQQTGGAGGADAVQVGQCRAGGGEQCREFFVRGLTALVDLLEVGDLYLINAFIIGPRIEAEVDTENVGAPVPASVVNALVATVATRAAKG